MSDQLVIHEPRIRPVALPNNARMAFTIQVALEAWRGSDPPNWAEQSGQLYGPISGMDRLARTIESEGFRGCIHISGLVAERWPDLVAGLARKGHEIVGHGWFQ